MSKPPKSPKPPAVVSTTDPLDRFVSVKAAIEESGIEIKAQSRAVSAVDSLVGGLIEVMGGAQLEGLRRRIRARDAIAERMIYQEGEAKLEEALATRAEARALRDLIKKQEAREAIVIELPEQLKMLPPPLQGGSKEEDAGGIREEIDPDWMNTFSQFAENATSEDLRLIWTRVLAGEILRPGAFSRSTMRSISELDIQVATAFEKIVQRRLPSGWIVPTADRSLSADIRNLGDAGFIQPQTFMPNPRESGGFLWWVEGDFALRITPKQPALGLSTMLFSELFSLSRTGREIAQIFPTPDTRRMLIEMAEFAKGQVDKIELMKITSRSGDGMHMSVDQIIFDSATQE